MEIFIDYLWFFLLYSFLGWVTEVSYQTIKKKKFVNRGFLNGPYCSIYGIGMSFLVFLFSPFDNLSLLFFGSIIITTVLEYITGYLLEKFFNKKWWDYSKEPYNLNGYIALFFSIRWGIGTLFTIVVIHPIILFLVSNLHNFFGYSLLTLLLTSLMADFIFTMKNILNIKGTYVVLDDIAEKIEEYSDQIGIGIYKKVCSAMEARVKVKEKLEEPIDSIMDLIENYEEIVDKRSYIQRRIEKAYPNLIKTKKKKNS